MLQIPDIINTIAVAIATLLLRAIAAAISNYYRSRKVRRFLEGEYENYYFMQIDKKEIYHVPVKISYDWVGPDLFHLKHNVRIERTLPLTGVKQTYYAAARRRNNFLDLEIVNLDTELRGHLVIAIPDHLDYQILAGIYLGTGTAGELAGWPTVLSKIKLSKEAQEDFLSNKSNTVLVPYEHFRKVQSFLMSSLRRDMEEASSPVSPADATPLKSHRAKQETS